MAYQEFAWKQTISNYHEISSGESEKMERYEFLWNNIIRNRIRTIRHLNMKWGVCFRYSWEIAHPYKVIIPIVLGLGLFWRCVINSYAYIKFVTGTFWWYGFPTSWISSLLYTRNLMRNKIKDVSIWMKGGGISKRGVGVRIAPPFFERIAPLGVCPLFIRVW